MRLPQLCELLWPNRSSSRCIACRPSEAEGTEAPFAAAENDPISRKFVEPPLPHLGADLGAQGVGHVEVSAADGAAAGVLRLDEAAPTSFQQLPRRLLLDKVAAGGAGIVPDKVFSLWERGKVPRLHHLGQQRPDGQDLKIYQLPQLQGAVGAGGVDALDAVLLQQVGNFFLPLCKPVRQ